MVRISVFRSRRLMTAHGDRQIKTTLKQLLITRGKPSQTTYTTGPSMSIQSYSFPLASIPLPLLSGTRSGTGEHAPGATAGLSSSVFARRTVCAGGQAASGTFFQRVALA